MSHERREKRHGNIKSLNRNALAEMVGWTHDYAHYLHLTDEIRANVHMFGLGSVVETVHQEAEKLMRLKKHHVLPDVMYNQACVKSIENLSEKSYQQALLLSQRKNIGLSYYADETFFEESFQHDMEINTALEQKHDLSGEEKKAIMNGYHVIENMAGAYLFLLTGDNEIGNKLFQFQDSVYESIMLFMLTSLNTINSPERQRLLEHNAFPLGRAIYSLENAENYITDPSISAQERANRMSHFAQMLGLLSNWYFHEVAYGKIKPNDADRFLLNYLYPPNPPQILDSFTLPRNKPKLLLDTINLHGKEGLFIKQLQKLFSSDKVVIESSFKSLLRAFLADGDGTSYLEQLMKMGILQTDGVLPSDILNILMEQRMLRGDQKLTDLSTYTNLIDMFRVRLYVPDEEYNTLVLSLSKDEYKFAQPLTLHGEPLPRIYFYISQPHKRITPQEFQVESLDPLISIKDAFSRHSFATCFVRLPIDLADKQENVEIELFPLSLQKNIHSVRNAYVRQRNFQI